MIAGARDHQASVVLSSAQHAARRSWFGHNNRLLGVNSGLNASLVCLVVTWWGQRRVAGAVGSARHIACDMTTWPWRRLRPTYGPRRGLFGNKGANETLGTARRRPQDAAGPFPGVPAVGGAATLAPPAQAPPATAKNTLAG